VKLAGLHYRERTSAIGGMTGFEGELRLETELEHDRLLGVVVIQAEDWSVGPVEPLRGALRRWAAAS
jgi:hypothetical protein